MGIGYMQKNNNPLINRLESLLDSIKKEIDPNYFYVVHSNEKRMMRLLEKLKVISITDLIKFSIEEIINVKGIGVIAYKQLVEYLDTTNLSKMIYKGDIDFKDKNIYQINISNASRKELINNGIEDIKDTLDYEFICLYELIYSSINDIFSVFINDKLKNNKKYTISEESLFILHVNKIHDFSSLLSLDNKKLVQMINKANFTDKWTTMRKLKIKKPFYITNESEYLEKTALLEENILLLISAFEKNNKDAYFSAIRSTLKGTSKSAIKLEYDDKKFYGFFEQVEYIDIGKVIRKLFDSGKISYNFGENKRLLFTIKK